MNSPYPRDLKGYGSQCVEARWPKHARIAIQFVLNYEEGGENCILHGDAASEAFLSDIIGAEALTGVRHMNMESMYEYGSRAGFWRIHRLFRERNLPLTVFGVAMAMERNPEAVAAMIDANWEIANHGYRWIDYQYVDIETERQHIKTALDIQKRLTGSYPSGWYTGRTSPNTRRLLLETGEFLYDSDSYADDLPYWTQGSADKPHLIIPYSLETNDMRFATAQGFHNSEQFFTYLKDSFDVLYSEGQSFPKMMSIGLHCRLIGRPGRFAALQRFLDYIENIPNVWICRRDDIAKHWWKHHAPHSENAS